MTPENDQNIKSWRICESEESLVGYAPKLLDIFILVHIIINTSCKLDVNILICMNKTKYELRLDWFVSTDVWKYLFIAYTLY